MYKNIKELKLPLQKIMDLGKVDGWLRGMSNITPKRIEIAEKLPFSPNYELNSHAMNYATPLESCDIGKMVGFRRLLQACSKNNIRVDLAMVSHTSLELRFEPAEPFSKSVILGVSYANVLPMLLPRPPP